MILALKGRSATDEVVAAEGRLDDARLNAEVLSVRAHRDAEPATVVRLAGPQRGFGLSPRVGAFDELSAHV